MTTKAATSGVTPEGQPWKSISVSGTAYKVRAITVKESDAAYDAALNPDKTFNGRLNSRLELCSAVMEPATTLDDIETWNVAKLVALLDVYNEVNRLPAADAEGND